MLQLMKIVVILMLIQVEYGYVDDKDENEDDIDDEHDDDKDDGGNDVHDDIY